MADYVYTSRIKDAAKSAGMRMAGDAVGSVNKAVDDMVKRAAARAKANGRKTIQPQDF